jgi:hypothetical protein
MIVPAASGRYSMTGVLDSVQSGQIVGNKSVPELLSGDSNRL